MGAAQLPVGGRSARSTDSYAFTNSATIKVLVEFRRPGPPWFWVVVLAVRQMWSADRLRRRITFNFVETCVGLLRACAADGHVHRLAHALRPAA